MKSNLKRSVGNGLIAATFLLLAPAVALACPVGKSGVTVYQQQSAVSSTPVDLQQSATIDTSTHWGSNFGAVSKTSGSQGLWGVNKATQAQTLNAGSQLWWAGNTGPTAARASTTGEVKQEQTAWGTQPMTGTQNAGTWQKSWVGNQVSQADANLSQGTFNVTGDLHQKQALAGKTQAEGRIWPAPASCVWCSQAVVAGGSFFSHVTVIVDNLFTF